jgi:hypothetical protein
MRLIACESVLPSHSQHATREESPISASVEGRRAGPKEFVGVSLESRGFFEGK